MKANIFTDRPKLVSTTALASLVAFAAIEQRVADEIGLAAEAAEQHGLEGEEAEQAVDAVRD